MLSYNAMSLIQCFRRENKNGVFVANTLGFQEDIGILFQRASTPSNVCALYKTQICSFVGH